MILSASYLTPNKFKNLKDMKSSCLSICTSFYYFSNFLLFFFFWFLLLFSYCIILYPNRLFFSHLAFLALDED